MSASDVFQKVLMDHYRSPRCTESLVNPSIQLTKVNPLCGDKVSLEVAVDRSHLNLAFEGEGCSISQASASILCEKCQGLSVSEAKQLVEKFKLLMNTDLEVQEAAELGDIAALQAVRQFPARIKCAELAWEALDEALTQMSLEKKEA